MISTWLTTVTIVEGEQGERCLRHDQHKHCNTKNLWAIDKVHLRDREVMDRNQGFQVFFKDLDLDVRRVMTSSLQLRTKLIPSLA